MRLLITNDDGINASGLRALVERALKHPDIEVTVVAPDRERSATGHAISIHQPIDLREIPIDCARAKVFASSGTPADCVKLAIQGIMGERPDFLISGIKPDRTWVPTCSTRVRYRPLSKALSWA